MNKTVLVRGMSLLLLGLLVSGCANRGLFGDGSCASGERVAVASNAEYAVYFDKNGEPVGPEGVAEDLLGTTNKKMCPTPQPGDDADPSVCPPGYCPRVMGGKTYCVRC